MTAEKFTENVTFSESPEMVERLEKMVIQEGTSRSALIRRALRLMVFSVPRLPESGIIPKPKDAESATK